MDTCATAALQASHCRPCKKFAPTYAGLAERFSDAVFLEIVSACSNSCQDRSKGSAAQSDTRQADLLLPHVFDLQWTMWTGLKSLM
jgi:thiol-disulfide isomerase/thioredoxin